MLVVFNNRLAITARVFARACERSRYGVNPGTVQLRKLRTPERRNTAKFFRIAAV